MKVLHEIKDKYEQELQKIANKSDLTPADLEATYKIVDILKDIETICAMKGSSSSQPAENSRMLDNLYSAMKEASTEEQKMAIKNLMDIYGR